MPARTRHEILIYRNTGNFPAEADAIFDEHGLLVHMINNEDGCTPEQIYTALTNYERNFYDEAGPLKELELGNFFRGLQTLLDAGYIRAEVRHLGTHGRTGKPSTSVARSKP